MGAAATPGRRAGRWIAGLVLGAGVAVRLLALDRPIAIDTPSAWREADLVQVARGFAREDLNPLHPRVYWRGNTTGEVELELPVLSWAGAVLFRCLGEKDVILRLLSAAFGIGALFAFQDLATHAIGGVAAWFATAAFAANGLLLAVSGSIQPESLQVLLLVVAGGELVRWWQSGTRRRLLLGCAWLAAAILAKSPSAHLGILLAWLCLRREGLRAGARPYVLGAALAALVPPLAWYAWAHGLYRETGLSLGLSNESHFLGPLLLLHPKDWVLGIARAEALDVFAVAGLPLAACAFLRPWKTIEFAAVWYAAALAFYGITADTSGDDWAFYYHVCSVPAACLLMGHGFEAIRLELARRAGGGVLAMAVAACVLGGAALRARSIHERITSPPQHRELYACARSLAQYLPAQARIAVCGGRMRDWHGHPVAFAESMVFTWMDRKGFVYGAEEASAAKLEELAREGAEYWFARPVDLGDPEIAALVARRFDRVASCGSHALYRLRSAQGGLDGAQALDECYWR